MLLFYVENRNGFNFKENFLLIHNAFVIGKWISFDFSNLSIIFPHTHICRICISAYNFNAITLSINCNGSFFRYIAMSQIISLDCIVINKLLSWIFQNSTWVHFLNLAFLAKKQRETEIILEITEFSFRLYLVFTCPLPLFYCWIAISHLQR